MSARNSRRKRWQEWNRRPSDRSMASREKRERYTIDDVTNAYETGRKVGGATGPDGPDNKPAAEVRHPTHQVPPKDTSPLAPPDDLTMDQWVVEGMESFEGMLDALTQPGMSGGWIPTKQDMEAAGAFLAAEQAEEDDDELVANVPPCPPWCVVDHGPVPTGSDLVDLRQCSDAGVDIRENLSVVFDARVTVRLVQCGDMLSGEVVTREVRVGKHGFDAASARRLAAEILNAADRLDELGD